MFGIPRDAPGPAVSPPPVWLSYPTPMELVRGTFRPWWWRKRFQRKPGGIPGRDWKGDGPRPLTFRTRGFRRG